MNTTISSRQQTITRLYFYEGLTLTEIAQELGISETAVSSHLKAALTSVRNELATGNESTLSWHLEKQLEEYFARAR